MDSTVDRFFLFYFALRVRLPDLVMCGVGDLETVLILVP